MRGLTDEEYAVLRDHTIPGPNGEHEEIELDDTTQTVLSALSRRGLVHRELVREYVLDGNLWWVIRNTITPLGRLALRLHDVARLRLTA